MLGSAVVDDIVHDHSDATRMCFAQQGIKVLQRAVLWFNAAEVGGGIAVVAVGAGGDGHQPDATDAQALQVVQALCHAAQVADAIAVTVAVAAHKNFHEGAALPSIGQHAAGVARLDRAEVYRCGGLCPQAQRCRHQAASNATGNCDHVGLRHMDSGNL